MFSVHLSPGVTNLAPLWSSAEPERRRVLHRERHIVPSSPPHVSHRMFCCEKHRAPRRWAVRGQKCPGFGPAATVDQGSTFLTSPGSGPWRKPHSERAEQYSQCGHLLLWQRSAQTSKEGSCSALILHLVIPLFTASRREQAFHFLEHCCIQPG